MIVALSRLFCYLVFEENKQKILVISDNVHKIRYTDGQERLHSPLKAPSNVLLTCKDNKNDSTEDP